MRAVMSIRGFVWTLGLCVVASLFELLRSGDWGEIGPLLIALVLASIALLGELSSYAWTARSGATLHIPDDLPPADGKVGIAQMFGVKGEPNPSDNRFRRFHSRDISLPRGVV